jgi:sugar O-acyltransferase (sialic acid O-acetyltransferase NeuD family)
MTRPMLVIGAGGHSRSCIDVIERHGGYEIIGLIGRAEEVGSYLLNYRVIGCDNDLPSLMRPGLCALVSVGQISANRVRQVLFEHLLQIGFELPVVVSPLAYISPHAEIGVGSIVMHHATISAGVKVGNNCIINSGAIVEHDCHVSDHCHVSTGSVINGGVHIGIRCFVGSGSVIREKCSVGDDTVIGMGISVRHNIGPNSVFVG